MGSAPRWVGISNHKSWRLQVVNLKLNPPARNHSQGKKISDWFAITLPGLIAFVSSAGGSLRYCPFFDCSVAKSFKFLWLCMSGCACLFWHPLRGFSFHPRATAAFQWHTALRSPQSTQKQTFCKWRLTLLPNCPLKLWLTNEIMEQVCVWKKREWDFKRRLFEDGNGWRTLRDRRHHCAN